MVIFTPSPPWNFQKDDRYVLHLQRAAFMLWFIFKLCKLRVTDLIFYSTSLTDRNINTCSFFFISEKIDWYAFCESAEKNEPRHDKTNKVSVHPTKTQISLGIRRVWSESSPSACRNLGSLATHWAHSEDSDQTGQMPKLIWVFARRTLILLVLSCRGSNHVQIIIIELLYV